MPRVTAFELHSVELPFRGKFEHAASARDSSSSLFLELRLEDGTSGWGEALPRAYVTGETLESACRMLAERILPRLLGSEFRSFEELIEFLIDCDGQAPADWSGTEEPHSAAWSAVDLALLDAYGRHFDSGPFPSSEKPSPGELRYSGVLTSSRNWKQTFQLLAFRTSGFRSLKLKLDEQTTPSELKRLSKLAGNGMSLRADLNMGWDLPTALKLAPSFARQGITSFEQPLPADQIECAARLVKDTGLEIMADESFSTRSSLDCLIEAKACTAINARISKCGGLVATLARCHQAASAGLWVQIGCQVGESSLLSAAHLHLSAAFGRARHAEGCFGRLLLAEDPGTPLLQIGWGGRPPMLPSQPGIGVDIDRACLARRRMNQWQGTES